MKISPAQTRIMLSAAACILSLILAADTVLPQSGAMPDRSSYIANKKGYTSPDLCAVLFLKNGIALEARNIGERQYYDQNNEYCYDPPRTDYYLTFPGGGELKAAISGTMFRAASMEQLVQGLTRKIITDKGLEPFGNDPKYVFAQKPVTRNISRFESVTDGVLVHRTARTRKVMKLITSMYTVNSVPLISLTMVQREALSSLNSLSVYRFTGSVVNGVVRGAEIDLKTTDNRNQSDEAIRRIIDALQGLLPESPPRDGRRSRRSSASGTGRAGPPSAPAGASRPTTGQTRSGSWQTGHSPGAGASARISALQRRASRKGAWPAPTR